MSFAVEAVSKRLATAGISHIITEGGQIVVESYDRNELVSTPTKATKVGKKWVITRNPKKKIKAHLAYALLMKLKRAAGYGKQEKKMREKLGDRAGHVKPLQSAALKKSPLLKAKKKAKKEAAKSGKPAKKVVKVAKKVAKPVKKTGKKRMV